MGRRLERLHIGRVQTDSRWTGVFLRVNTVHTSQWRHMGVMASQITDTSTDCPPAKKIRKTQQIKLRCLFHIAHIPPDCLLADAWKVNFRRSFFGSIFAYFLWSCPGNDANNLNSTHWGRDKMDDISQTTFSSAFSWMKMFEFRLKIHLSLFLRVQLTIFQHWFR